MLSIHFSISTDLDQNVSNVGIPRTVRLRSTLLHGDPVCSVAIQSTKRIFTGGKVSFLKRKVTLGYREALGRGCSQQTFGGTSIFRRILHSRLQNTFGKPTTRSGWRISSRQDLGYQWGTFLIRKEVTARILLE